MTQTVHFTTSDSVDIVGDLSIPDNAIGAAIVCHPHPQFGGNRHNNVVQALFDALPDVGIAALCFDFRSNFDNGRGEALDAIAALDHLAVAVPDVALFATGYSFGAIIALRLDDPRLAAKALVAPPLAAMPDFQSHPQSHPDRVPMGLGQGDMLILTPAHDQFSAPDATEAIISEWPQTIHETIASTDHFLGGRTATVAERVTDYLTAFVGAT